MKPWFASIVAIVLVLTTLVSPVARPTWAQQGGTGTPAAATVVLTADTAVRAWPSPSAEVLGTLRSGSTVVVSARTPEGDWWQTPYPSGPNGFGWLASQTAAPNAAAATVPQVQIVFVTPTPGPTTAAKPAVKAAETPAAQPRICVYDVAFVGDVTIPDRTLVMPGQSFYKAWRLANSGTCAWGAGVQLAFAGGSQMSGPATVPVPATIAGATIDLGLTAVAPAQPGVYTGVWQMRDPANQPFGPRITVVVMVTPPTPSAPAPAPTFAPAPPPQSGPVAQPTSGLYVPPGGYPAPAPTLPPLTIDFYSDDTHLDRDHCSTIHWDVEGAQGVFVRDDNSMHGVPGHGSSQVCPTGGGRTYTLKVIHADGTQEERNIRISIN
jgi:hypothetical protein